MPFKINVGLKGKTQKFESDNESLVGTKIGEKIDGGLVSEDLAGYELEVTGTSDKAGFPGFQEVNSAGLKKVLLTYGKGMHKRPKKEGKKEYSNKNPKGLRLRKTVRGNEISLDTVQINLKVLKEGSTKFGDLNKKAEAPAEGEGAP
jgi:small subunit ribosomal protein S6e